MKQKIHAVVQGALALALMAAASLEAQTLETLAEFSTSGTGPRHPYGNVVQGSDGNFYGTTAEGGASNMGTVFRVTPAGVVTTLVSFDGANGSFPEAGLVRGSDGNFYGTTRDGEAHDYGTVFKVTPSGVLTTLVVFYGGNGATPRARLVQGSDGNYYGTTDRGGPDWVGTVFKVTPGGTLTTLAVFNVNNGARPKAGLVQGTDGNFYGTTELGGASNRGTVFKVTPAGLLTTLFSFNGSNGMFPVGGLVRGNDGNFYGMAAYGGENDHGTVFRVTSGGALMTQVFFNGGNGSNPRAGLVLGSDGNFHGTTAYGGANDHGTVFIMTPAGALTPVVSFTGSNGSHPEGGLVAGSDGHLYGTTSEGGAFGGGTVHRVKQFQNTAPFITTHPASRTAIYGMSINLSVTAGGTQPLAYQWRKGGANIANLNGPVLVLTNLQAGDAGTYSVIVTNAFGSLTSSNAVLVVNPPPSLAESVDAPELTWTTGGSAPWTGQITETHDGEDAAQSGAIIDAQVSWLQTTVQGPGVLVFWWKVSSETGFDYLELYVNGVLQLGRISGETGWMEQMVNIPAGAQTLRWQYTKDNSVSEGQDQGWLDRVRYLPSSGPPAIVTHPRSQLAATGETVSMDVLAVGQAPLRFQWHRNGAPINLATNSSYQINNLLTNHAGVYHVSVTNSLGALLSSNAVLTVVPAISLAEATDAPQLAWTTGGGSPWTGQTNVTHDGADAAQSGVITDNQESWMETTVQGPGTLRFWWRVSSEAGFDHLEFHINGVLQEGRISGGTGWQQKTNSVAAGTHTLRWKYKKDGSVSTGQDRGWVDEVSYVQPQPLVIMTTGGGFGFNAGKFGFNITGESGQTLVVEASSTVPPGSWTPVWTNTLGGGPLYFSDPQSVTNAARYYRVRTP